MRIALFGANGQLGQAIRRACASLDEGFSEVFQVQLMNRSDVQVDENYLCKRLTSVDCTAVINCVAWTDVDGAESHQEGTWALNAEFPKMLATATARIGVPLVHISTEAVFSGSNRKWPYTEADQPDPLTTYAKSKRAGEVAVFETDGRAVVLRTSWLYAANASSNFPTRLKSQLKLNSETVSVVTDVIGNPTPAATLADAILKSLKSCLPGGLYHVACVGSVSKYDWALHLCELWGFSPNRVKPTTTTEYPSLAQRSLSVDLDSSKFQAAGIMTLPRWEEASRRYWAGFPT